MKNLKGHGVRNPVIANIQKAADDGRFNDKVEVNDPHVSHHEQMVIVDNFLQHYGHLGYQLNNWTARTVMNLTTRYKVGQLTVHGRKNLDTVHGGAIVTSNHFNPTENMVVRKALGMPRMNIVSQATNLKMPGFLGYMMNYADILPLTTDMDYLGRQFPALLKQVLDKGHDVLIYPEQEMWFNYTKPRPPKRGAYYYAARFQVPIISCFVASRALPQMADDTFHELAYTAYILKPIFPDPKKSVRDNSMAMMHQDYQQKVAAYEKAYHKPLDYHFSPSDIAGLAV